MKKRKLWKLLAVLLLAALALTACDMKGKNESGGGKGGDGADNQIAYIQSPQRFIFILDTDIARQEEEQAKYPTLIVECISLSFYVEKGTKNKEVFSLAGYLLNISYTWYTDDEFKVLAQPGAAEGNNTVRFYARASSGVTLTAAA